MAKDGFELMCVDAENARRSREKVADKTSHRAWWKDYEKAIAATPVGAPLPSDVPIGNLPYAGKRRTSNISEEDSL